MPIARAPFALPHLFGGLYALSMVTVAASVILLLNGQLSAYFHRELVNNGRTITEQLAEDSRWVVLQGTAENLQPRLDTLTTYPNLIGIVIATRQGLTLANWGSQPVTPQEAFQANARAQTEGRWERENALTLIAPVHGPSVPRATPDPNPFGEPVFRPEAMAAVSPLVMPPEPVGFVALTFSKVSIHTHLQRLHEQVLLVMVAVGFVVTVLMGYALRQITHPIQHLARVMSDPDTVRTFQPVDVAGVREAQSIAHAFNALIAQVAATHQALAASNAALTASQASLAQQVAAAVQEVKQQNAELVQAREQAVAASRVKSEFMANMSHEIRTPLHGVIGFITVLAKTPLNATQKSYVHLLKNAAHSLLEVINSILDFSKLEAGKTVLQPQPFRLQEMVESTVHLFIPNARAKGLQLSVSVDPQRPEMVVGDCQRLAQIVRNLVDNAIKFTVQGQVQVQVHARRHHDHTLRCRLIVQDTGIGIPKAHLTSIFTAFNQVDASTTRQQGGTGLGLAICQQLTTLMQGRLRVKSQEGMGSAFYVDVPLSIADAAEAIPTDPAPQPDGALNLVAPAPVLPPIDVRDVEQTLGGRGRGGPTRVLVVDDHLTNRLYAKIVLAHFPTVVDLAENGEAALAACRQQRYDLILMDIRMSGMDGLETTRRIRRWQTNPNCRAPILGLTADVLNVDHQDGKAAGLNDCVFKPLDEAQMRQIFTRWGLGQAPDAYSMPNFLQESS